MSVSLVRCIIKLSNFQENVMTVKREQLPSLLQTIQKILVVEELQASDCFSENCWVQNQKWERINFHQKHAAVIFHLMISEFRGFLELLKKVTSAAITSVHSNHITLHCESLLNICRSLRNTLRNSFGQIRLNLISVDALLHAQFFVFFLIR